MWFKKKPSRPTAAAAARRVLILKQLSVLAITAPPREMLQAMRGFGLSAPPADLAAEADAERDQFCERQRKLGLWDHLSPSEREFAQSTFVTMTLRQQLDFSWRTEAVVTLMWALGLLPQLTPYDTSADHDLLKGAPPEGVAKFVSAACLRDPPEIDRARDLAELWHWRSRTRQLVESGETFRSDEQTKALGLNSFDDIVRLAARRAAQEGGIPLCIDDDFPVKGKAYRDLSADEWSEVKSITMERHFTLNWLCGYAPGNRWDDTPTDT